MPAQTAVKNLVFSKLRFSVKSLGSFDFGIGTSVPTARAEKA